MSFDYSMKQGPQGSIFFPKSLLKPEYEIIYEHYGYIIQAMDRIRYWFAKDQRLPPVVICKQYLETEKYMKLATILYFTGTW